MNRERELAALTGALERAVDGHGGLVLIGGEAGIGKTSLVRQLTARPSVAEDRVQVAWGRCWESGGAPSMWPWTAVLRELVADRDATALREQLGSAAPWLVPVVPELRDALPELEDGRAPDSEQSRFVLFDALAQFLRRAGAEKPLAVVLDDIHAADRLSLLALLFLARQLDAMRVLVVATHRDIELERDSQDTGLFTKLFRAGHRLTLAGLEPEEVGQLLAYRRGGTAAPDVSQALHRATGGNPLFADEVIRLLEPGDLVGDAAVRLDTAALPVPSTVRGAIEQRLEGLPEYAERVLRMAAVIGDRFALGTLARACGQSQHEIQMALAPALGGQLIVSEKATASFRFAHGLIRETAYAAIEHHERGRAHAAVGAALVARLGATADRHLEELAHHFLQALPDGDAALALEYAQRAADHALAGFAHERAARLYAAALEALDLLDALDDAQRDLRRARLLLGLGRAQQRTADPEARETLLDAAVSARAVGSADVLAEVALAFGSFGLSPGVVDSELTALLEEALELVGQEDSAERVRLTSRLARAIYWSADDERRRALIDESIAIARRIGDPAVLAFALGNCIAARRSPDSAKEELAWIDEVLALPQAPGELVVLARNIEIDLLLERGILGAADAAIDALERLSQQLRDVRARPYAHVHRARRAVMEGRWADAERSIDEADRAAATLDDSTFPMTVGGVRFVLALARGRPADLEPELRQLATNLPTMAVWDAGLAWIHASKGEQHEAARLLERLAADQLARIPRNNMWPITIALLAQSCAAIGDSGHARPLYDALAPFSELITISPVAGYLGPVARLLGLLAETLGERADAERHLRAALELARRHRVIPMISTIALDLARVIDASDPDTRSEAIDLLTEAERGAEELEMPALAERARSVAEALPEAARVRGKPKRASRKEATAPPLSAAATREGEVWSFEFEGRTVRVRDSKGVRTLAELLAHPSVELDAIQLDRGRDPGPPATRRTGAEELSLHDPGAGAGPALDETAKSAYRRRLDDLREELDEAERFNDPERIARARDEIDFIAHELSSAVGLGGRDRPQAAAAERARVNVTRAVKTAIRRLSEQDVAIGAELKATVQTGRFCSYRPDPRRPIEWDVDAG